MIRSYGLAVPSRLIAVAVLVLASACSTTEFDTTTRPSARVAPSRALLGLVVEDRTGVVVDSAEAGMPAAGAGIVPGARILSVNGTKIESAAQLDAVLGRLHSGAIAYVTWRSSGRTFTASIPLATAHS